MKTTLNARCKIFFVLFVMFDFCASAYCQQALKYEDSRLKNIVLDNIKYPEEAKINGIEGEFYVISKLHNGNIENFLILDKVKKIRQPIIFEVSIIDKTIENQSPNTRNYISKPIKILENEALRVTKLFMKLNTSEWNPNTTEFAIRFRFKLAE